MNLGKTLKDLRIAKNLTQDQVAQAVGVTQRTVSAWERNTATPGVTLLVPLSKLFDVTLDELLDNDYF